MWHSSIRLYTIDEGTPGVLHSKSCEGVETLENSRINASLTVTVVVVHPREHVDCVRVESKIRTIDHPEGIQLMAQSSFSKDKLSRICSVQTVYTVGPTDTVLQGDCTSVRYDIPRMPGLPLSLIVATQGYDKAYSYSASLRRQ